jgi:hypothetical protein
VPSRRPQGPHAPARRFTRRLTDRLAHRLLPADREVLWLYAATRLGLWVCAYCARWLFPADGSARHPAPVLSSWQQWDWSYYLRIARDGYFPAGAPQPGTTGWDNREAFFPGFPLVLRAAHTVVRDWTAAGLLVSFAAGAVAVLALARIARLDLPGVDDGRRTVRLFLLSPCALFLAVGYTESLFLALALPAWLAARRANWPLAGLLSCLACAVRISGVFLVAAMCVQFLCDHPARRARELGHSTAAWVLRVLPWLALPALSPLAYAAYLHAHTGDWWAWKHAENRGWYRDFTPPWTAWHHTWTAAFGHTQAAPYAVEFQFELLAAVVGLALVALLLVRRRWPEAVYAALGLGSLCVSYWYMSIPRATLLWWPLWTALAAATARRPRLETLYLCAAAPLSTVLALAFLTGRWAG